MGHTTMTNTQDCRLRTAAARRNSNGVQLPLCVLNDAAGHWNDQQ